MALPAVTSAVPASAAASRRTRTRTKWQTARPPSEVSSPSRRWRAPWRAGLHMRAIETPQLRHVVPGGAWLHRVLPTQTGAVTTWACASRSRNDSDHGADSTSERGIGAKGMYFLTCASLHLIVPTVSEVGRCGVAAVARRGRPAASADPNAGARRREKIRRSIDRSKQQRGKVRSQKRNQELDQ